MSFGVSHLPPLRAEQAPVVGRKKTEARQPFDPHWKTSILRNEFARIGRLVRNWRQPLPRPGDVYRPTSKDWHKSRPLGLLPERNPDRMDLIWLDIRSQQNRLPLSLSAVLKGSRLDDSLVVLEDAPNSTRKQTLRNKKASFDEDGSTANLLIPYRSGTSLIGEESEVVRRGTHPQPPAHRTLGTTPTKSHPPTAQEDSLTNMRPPLNTPDGQSCPPVQQNCRTQLAPSSFFSFVNQATLSRREWGLDLRQPLDYIPCARCRLRGGRCSNCKVIRTGGGYIILEDQEGSHGNPLNGEVCECSSELGNDSRSLTSVTGRSGGGRGWDRSGNGKRSKGYGNRDSDSGMGLGSAKQSGSGQWTSGNASDSHTNSRSGTGPSDTDLERGRRENGGRSGQHNQESVGGSDSNVDHHGNSDDSQGYQIGGEELGRGTLDKYSADGLHGDSGMNKGGTGLAGDGNGEGGGYKRSTKENRSSNLDKQHGRGYRGDGDGQDGNHGEDDGLDGKKGKRKKKKGNRDEDAEGGSERDDTGTSLRKLTGEYSKEEDESRKQLPQGDLRKFRSKKSDVKALSCTLNELKDIDPLDYLAKYCILDPEKMPHYRRVYDNVDRDEDDEINIIELDFALKSVNYDLISDPELTYVHSILELAGRWKLNFRLFSLIAALSEKIVSLEDMVKKLINEMNFEALQVKMKKCKELFYLLDSMDSTGRGGVVTTSSLAVELQAGGLTSEHVEYVVDRLNYEGKGIVEFLDYLTYVPLFIEIHDYICGNPLDLSRNK